MSGWVRRKTTVHIWDESGKIHPFYTLCLLSQNMFHTFAYFPRGVLYFPAFSWKAPSLPVLVKGAAQLHGGQRGGAGGRPARLGEVG